MLSTQLEQAVPDFDEVIRPTDADFAASGLRQISMLRSARVAVIATPPLIGAIGAISPVRLTRIDRKLVDWMNALS